MGDVVFLRWALVLLLFALMSTSSWYVGTLFSQLLLRLGNRNKQGLFEKWGVAAALLRPRRLIWLVLQGIVVVTVSLYLFLLSWVALSFAMGEDTSGISVPFFTLYVIFFAFSVGLLWEIRRTEEILTMVAKLEELCD